MPTDTPIDTPGNVVDATLPDPPTPDDKLTGGFTIDDRVVDSPPAGSLVATSDPDNTIPSTSGSAGSGFPPTGSEGVVDGGDNIDPNYRTMEEVGNLLPCKQLSN